MIVGGTADPKLAELVWEILGAQEAAREASAESSRLAGKADDARRKVDVLLKADRLHVGRNTPQRYLRLKDGRMVRIAWRPGKLQTEPGDVSVEELRVEVEG